MGEGTGRKREREYEECSRNVEYNSAQVEPIQLVFGTNPVGYLVTMSAK